MNPVAWLRERYAVSVDPLRTERRLELGALVLALLFCLQLVFSGLGLAFFGAPDAVPPAEDALRLADLENARQVAEADSRKIRNRPLFWPSRRPLDAREPEPDSAVETKTAASPAALKNVTLQGVFGSDETSGIIALVKGKKQRILIGEELEGWQLESVEPDRVELVDGGRRHVLALKTAAIKAPEVPKQAAPEPEKSAARSVPEPKKGSDKEVTEPVPTPPADPRGISLRR